jgi:hypothetical protein
MVPSCTSMSGNSDQTSPSRSRMDKPVKSAPSLINDGGATPCETSRAAYAGIIHEMSLRR